MSNEQILVKYDCPECMRRRELYHTIDKARSGKGSEAYNLCGRTMYELDEFNKNCQKCKGTGKIESFFPLSRIKELLGIS